MGVRGGIDLVSRENQSYRVIPVDGNIRSVSVCDNLIHTLIYESDNLSVRVYGSDYQQIQ